MEPTLDRMLRSFVHAWPAAVLVFDRARRVVYANPAGRTLFGNDLDRLTPEQRSERWTLRDQAGRLVSADVAPSAHALRGDTVFGGQYQFVRRDGSSLKLIIDAYPIRDEAGTVVAAACVLTERRDERRIPDYRLFEGIANWLETVESGRAPDETVAILADTGRAVTASLDYESTLNTLVRGVVPRLAHACVIRLLDEHGAVHRLNAAFATPELAARAAKLEPYYAAWTTPEAYATSGGLGAVLRTGQSVLMGKVSDEWLRGVAMSDAHLAAMRALGATSIMHVPILRRSQPMGAITFLRTSGAAYEMRDLALAEELCDRAAVAIENARLFRDSERRRREAELLSDVARVLVETMDPRLVAQRIADGVKVLLEDTASAAVYSFESVNETAYAVAVSTESGVSFPWTRVLPPGAGVIALAVARREIVSVSDVLERRDVKYPPDARAKLEATEYRAVTAIPLIAHDRVLGALAVGARAGRRYESREIALLSAFADQAAVAFHNARLFEDSEHARAVAESANRSKDDFLAILSHELRTPLTAMLGWVRMLDRGLLSPARTAEALNAIERNARLQARLINDLLDVSRIVTGKLDVERRLVDLGAVVRDVIDAARQDPHARALLADPVLEPGADLVAGDRVRLQQVVTNLVLNAVKYTPAEGRIDVALRRVEDQLELTVTDTGEGIDPADLTRIFERFHQADVSKTRRHGGLGLGLTIVRHLVELHGGTVHAHSAGRGRGATFTIRLPRAVAVPALAVDTRRPLAAMEAETRPLRNVRVLFVDDNEDARALVSTALQAAGAQVEVSGSATEALHLLDTTAFDVIVSDVGMPDMDGYEFVRELRARRQGPHLPAIALSAYAGVDDARRALAAGFQRHVAKPVDPADLVSIVRNVIAA